MAALTPGEIKTLTFGCRLNALESEVMRASGRGGRPRRRACWSTPARSPPRRCARRGRRSARRGASNPDARIVVTGCAAQIDPAAFAAMPEVDLVLGNAEKLTAAALSRLRRRRRRAGPRQRHHVGARDRGAPDRGHGRPRARLRRGAERLRPPLHLLHHPLRPRQFALGADGRGGRPDPPARREAATARWCSPASTSPSYGADLPGRPSLGRLVRSRSSGTCRSWSGCASPRSTRSRPTTRSSTRSPRRSG